MTIHGFGLSASLIARLPVAVTSNRFRSSNSLDRYQPTKSDSTDRVLSKKDLKNNYLSFFLIVVIRCGTNTGSNTTSEIRYFNRDLH